jgi:hypothetical protein
MSLHDRYLPQYHFREVHRISVAASPDKIYQCARNLDFSGSTIIRLLFFLRGMPARMMSLEGLGKENFKLLEERAGEELIIGLIGQFWKPSGNLQDFEPTAFGVRLDGLFARATWNFRLEQNGHKTILETETRIWCPDEETRKKFGRYWFVIRPFSGLIRMEMLRAIRKTAETKQP